MLRRCIAFFIEDSCQDTVSDPEGVRVRPRQGLRYPLEGRNDLPLTETRPRVLRR